MGGAWSEIAAAETKSASRYRDQYYHGLDSDLASLAYLIVDYVAEVKKPDAVRLPGFHEAQLESLKQRMYSPAPVYPAMEIARMTGALQLDIEGAGKDDAFVQAVLGGKTPAEAASTLVGGTKMADPAFRKKLVDGGEAAVNASETHDCARPQSGPDAPELIKWMQDNVQSVEQQAGEKLGKARFAAYGKNTYPTRPSRCASPMGR